jgi:hypothetical protein
MNDVRDIGGVRRPRELRGEELRREAAEWRRAREAHRARRSSGTGGGRTEHRLTAVISLSTALRRLAA